MRSKVFTIVCIVICAVLLCTFFACKAKVVVQVPTGLDLEGNVLTWNDVSGAIEYEVYVDDETVTVYESRYVLEIYDYEVHTVSVAAVTPDGKSAPSESVIYVREPASAPTLPVLSAPSNGLKMTSNRLMWNNVSGNNGYRIYFNNTTIDIPKDVTYYVFDFPATGTYDYRIYLQTVGDGLTYYSSAKYEFLIHVENGSAPLLQLDAVQISFNPATKRIEWNNRHSAETVTYEIYKNSVLESSILANSQFDRMGFEPTLTGAQVSYSLRLVSNDGLYNPSDMSDPITFPIADAVPSDFRLERNEEGAYVFAWKEGVYYTGYLFEIDGQTYDVGYSTVDGVQKPNAYAALPSGLSQGMHKARVGTKGDNVYYANSPRTQELVFTLGASGLPETSLETPEIRSLRSDGSTYFTLVFTSVEGASAYNVRFVYGEEEKIYTVTQNGLSFRAGDGADADAFFALPMQSLSLSVSAVSSRVNVRSSPYSVSCLVAESEDVLAAPAALSYGAYGFTWDSVEGATQYEVSVNGEVTRVDKTSYQPRLSEGTYLVKVRAVPTTGLALYSEEIVVSVPVLLAAPTALRLTQDVLSFAAAENSAGYELYANGKKVATLSSKDTRVDLTNHITTDGKYTLSLRTLSPSLSFESSAFSEEIFYVKTNAVEGTSTKPYRVSTPAEFVTFIARDPSAYFDLTAASYDFSNVDVTALSKVTFSGHIFGHNATLDHIKLFDSFFASIKEAEIIDLTFDFDAQNVACERSGLFADLMENVRLSNVKIILAGSANATEESSCGLLTYRAEETDLDAVTLVVSDLTFTSDHALALGALAHTLTGEAKGLVTQGSLRVSAQSLAFAGVAVTGEFSLSSGTTLSLKATGSAPQGALSIFGVTETGEISLSNVTVNGGAALTADRAYYFGVTGNGGSFDTVTVAGAVTVEARICEAFGLMGEGVSSLKTIVSSLTLICEAQESALAAGVAKRLSEGSSTADRMVFSGSLSLTAPDVKAAGITAYAETALLCKVKGSSDPTARSLSGSGASVALAGASLEAVDADVLFESASFEIKDAPSASFAGVTLDAAGRLAASGNFDLIAKEGISLLSVSGVMALDGAEAAVAVNDLSISADLKATDELSFGGVIDTADRLSGSVSALSVDLTAEAENLIIGGVLARASDLALTGNTTVDAKVSAVGVGRVAGFGADLLGVSFSNVLVTGDLSFKGSGMLCGVTADALNLSNAESRANLTAEGTVILAGVAGEVDSASNVRLTDADLTVLSDQAEIYGVAKSVGTGAVSGAISGVSFVASPVSKAGSVAKVCGVTSFLGSSRAINMTNTSFDISYFASADFAAVAEEAQGTISALDLSYSLRCLAALSRIGGVFGNLTGNVDGLALGTTSEPVKMTVKGQTSLGGLARFADASFAGVNAALRLALDLSEASDVGGAFAEVSNEVSFERSSLAVNVRKEGEGQLFLGGAAARLSGVLRGANVNVDFASNGETDKLGGVVSLMTGGRLFAACARGAIARAAGGVVYEASEKASIEESVSTVSLLVYDSVSDSYLPKGGGILYAADDITLKDVYSLSVSEAGLLYGGNKVTVKGAVYFGGKADYSVAHDLSDVTYASSGKIFLEAALRGNDEVGVGSAPVVTYRTLACGGSDDGFAESVWDLSETHYPSLRAVETVLPVARIDAPEALDEIMLTDGLDLYTVLPSVYSDSVTSAIVWVDETGKAEITDGYVMLMDSGEGVLKGYVSGKVLAYEVPYLIENFIPFEGNGSAGDPYIVANMAYFKHIPAWANAYAAAHPDETAYFKIAAGEYENVSFPSFTTSYAAHILGNEAVFRSPKIGANGIFGMMTGGSVSALTLVDPETEGVVLLSSATDVDLSYITVRGGQSTLIGGMTRGSLRNLSFYATIDTEEDAEIFVIGESEDAVISSVQYYVDAKHAASFALSLVRSDVGSSFDHCLVIIVGNAEDDYPFAYSAKNSSFRASAAILYYESAPETYSLIYEATGVTFEDVLVAANGAVDISFGVAEASFGEIAASLVAAPYSFLPGVLPTPVGYALFGVETDTAFSLTDLEGEALTELALDSCDSILLSDYILVSGETPFAESVGYSVDEAVGRVEQGVLYLTGANGKLKITNLYGVVREVDLVITNYTGFSAGRGTDTEPYVITLPTHLSNMVYHAGACFVLGADIDLGTFSTSLALAGGVLDGAGHTIFAILSGAPLFAECTGRLENITFELSGGSVAQSLFLEERDEEELSALTLEKVTFILGALDWTAEESLGLLFAKLDAEMTLREVSVNAPESIKISAPNGGTFGLLAASAYGARLENVSLTAKDVRFETAEGAIFGGLIGSLASEYTNEVALESVTAEIKIVARVTQETATLALGGVLGCNSYVGVSVVNVKADITVNSSAALLGEVKVGGIVGENYGEMTSLTLRGGSTVTVYAAAGVVGGVAGLDAENGTGLSGISVNASVYCETASYAYAGGVAGRSEGNVGRGFAQGNVTAKSRLTEVSLLSDSDADKPVLSAAGGVVGYGRGNVSIFSVGEVTLQASADDYTGDGAYVLAGGIGGYLREASDVKVESSALSATGGDAYAGGVAALLLRWVKYAVIADDVTLTANRTGAAVGIFSFASEASVARVVSAANVPALVGRIFLLTVEDEEVTGEVRNNAYLYGDPVGEFVSAEHNYDNDKYSDLSEFYGDTVYSAQEYDEGEEGFDVEIWSFHTDSLPVLDYEA